MLNQQLAETDLILNTDGSIYHLHLREEHIADNVIVVGDQGRVSEISKHFDKIETKIHNREFVTHTGVLGKNRITVLSTGIGTDNIDIVINELDAAINIDHQTRKAKSQLRKLNIVRIGTSGALQADIPVGSHVISQFGLGLDGLLHFYEYKFNEHRT
jgi:uridine phosphorylase